MCQTRVWVAFFLGLYTCIFSLAATYCIDVSPFDFKTEQKKGWRIIVLNLESHVVEGIYYCPCAPSVPKNNCWRKGEICVSQKGITFKKDFVPQQYVLVVQTQKHPLVKMHPSGKFTFFSSRAFFKCLQPTIGRTKRALKIIWYEGDKKQDRTLNTLSSSSQDNKQERGALGERVTMLYCLLHGYKEMTSPNESNQGLDGAFLSREGHILILTESKCRNENKKAKRYLAEDLRESKIIDKLSKIRNSLERKRLEAYIEAPRVCVLKLAQRLLPNGCIESALAPLDRLLYVLAKYPHFSKAPSHIQEEALTELLKRLSPDKRFLLIKRMQPIKP